ncbi:MAG: Gfo/Idh/MocA family oxidoreductase [Anaerolineales bacterium]|nr:Gfo/Idh/MocA family oxidoreductase [Anaerolineales bacterium]
MVKGSAPNPVRLAIIGAGIFARETHTPALLRLAERFQVVAVCSRGGESAAALAQQFGADVAVVATPAEVLARDDVDAVDIVLPIDAQAPVVADALRSGKHVISEKPIAPDSATAQALIELHSAQTGQVWMVAENWRYEDAYVRAAEVVKSGVLGRILTVHLTHFAPMTPANKYYKTAWRRAGGFPGGFLVDGGVHNAAILRLIAGEVDSVTAFTTQANADLPPVDTLGAALRFASGALGVYLNTYAAGTPFNAPLTLVGSQGSLRVERGRLEITRNDGKVETEVLPAMTGVQHELAAFADAIQFGVPHRNTPQEALRDLQLIEAMLRAANERIATNIL